MALIWGAIIGWLVWDDVPSGWTWAGAAIVAAAGGYIALREAHLERRRKAIAAQVTTV